MVFTNQFSLENVFFQWVAIFCAYVKDFILNCIQKSMIQLGFPYCSRESYPQLKQFCIAPLTSPEQCQITPAGCPDPYSERKPLSLQICSLKIEEDLILILFLD